MVELEAYGAVVYSLVYDPVSRAAPRPSSAADRFVVGMVGRIAPWKGQHVFLEAFARAFGDGTELAVVVGDAMFGEAEADYGAELRELSRDAGNRAIASSSAGFRDDVWAELAGMDVLVHASIAARAVRPGHRRSHARRRPGDRLRGRGTS